MSTYLDFFDKIKAFVFDVDGVLTNGQVVLLPDGQQMRQMNSKDGYALQLALKKGYQVGIITGGKNIQVRERLSALGITDVYMGISHKNEALEDFRLTYNLRYDQIMYMGDDIPDLSALMKVELSCCPADAAPELIDTCKYVSKIKGGSGCARDIIEKVMRSHSNWYDPAHGLGNFAEFTW